MEDLRYWYGSALKGGSTNPSLPPQAIPLSKKNDKWKKATMDSLESIGLNQLADNMKFADIFRMISGKMSYTELSDVMPQYRELEQALDDVEFNTWIRHYDIIGIIINALAGELSVNSDEFSISTIDEISSNEYIRTKTDKLLDYVMVEFEKELELRLLSSGINPNVPDDAFQSQEELEAYKQQIQQKKAEMTPPQIEKYMSTSWKTAAAKWASIKMKEDRILHDMDNMDVESFIQFLATGRCFRNMHVSYDYYKPENWHVLNTFFSQDLNTKLVQNGDYVGRIHKFSRAQVIDRYGYKMTPKEQKKLMQNGYDSNYLGGSSEDNFFGEGANVSYKKMFESHFHRLQTVAFEDEPEYKLSLDIQNSLGIPMGERMILNRDGDYEKVPVLLPEINNVTGNLGVGVGNEVFSNIRNDVNLRTDLVTVTEAFFRSYKRVGYIKFKDEEGNLTTSIVTEEILPEMLKYYGIKEVNSIPLERLEDEQEENTIVWIYQPEIWEGVKINDGIDPFYLDIKPCDIQIMGDGNMFDVLLPVAGILDNSLALKIEPYQVMYNVVMNQIFNLLEKEIGLFFIFDINFLPSEFKNWGDTEETLMYMRDIAKDIGLVPLDTSKQNLVGGANFNQFTSQNLTYASQIEYRMQLAEFIKNKAFEQIGITPQRLGAPNKYENTEGIKVSQDASYAQTEQYFSKFSLFIKKSLELQIKVAQFCQKDGKDLRLFFTQDDSTQAFIHETDDDFNFRQFTVVPISNSKKREQLKTFKSWLIQTNTLGTDELAMAELITSDSMSEIIEAARSARLDRQKEETQKQQLIGEQQQQLEEYKNQAADSLWQKQEISKDKDRKNKIDVATINAFGRAADKDSDKSNFDLIERQANISLQQTKATADASNKAIEANIKQQKLEEDKLKRIEDTKVKLAELATRRAISEDNKYIARINKN